MKAGNKLLDFAGPGCKVYQVTVSEEHTMCGKGLEELFIASGQCNRINGKLVVAENADHMEMIHFYWVPAAKKKSWASKKPKTKKNDLLSKCLKHFVDQYILIMEMDAETESDDTFVPQASKKKKR